MTTPTRRCSICRQTLPITAFARNRTGNDQQFHRRYQCKPCALRLRDRWLASLDDAAYATHLATRRAYDARTRQARDRAHREDAIETPPPVGAGRKGQA